MGVSKIITVSGNGKDRPKVGDQVFITYAGYLYDSNKPGNRGKCFDSTKSRGEFKTEIGVGKVIRGWDDGILRIGGGMTLNEQATLTISSDYGYGASGFPGLIPGGSSLIFDIELKAINGKRS